MDLTQLYNNPKIHDGILVLSDRNIYINKCILAIHSEFFKSLFFGGGKYMKSPGTGGRVYFLDNNTSLGQYSHADYEMTKVCTEGNSTKGDSTKEMITQHDQYKLSVECPASFEILLKLIHSFDISTIVKEDKCDIKQISVYIDEYQFTQIVPVWSTYIYEKISNIADESILSEWLIFFHKHYTFKNIVSGILDIFPFHHVTNYSQFVKYPELMAQMLECKYSTSASHESSSDGKDSDEDDSDNVEEDDEDLLEEYDD